MYYVTGIEQLNTRKCKVTINDAVTLPLYKSEIRKYRIECDGCIPSEVYENDILQMLYKRGRERSLYLLEARARSEHEIYSKLHNEYYPQEIIEKIISFLKKYHYIDDFQYATQFYEFKSKTKSVMQIKNELLKKGIKQEIISSVLDEVEFDESKVIRQLIKKRVKSYARMDDTNKNKLYMSLRRKGFKHADIIKCLNEHFEQSEQALPY